MLREVQVVDITTQVQGRLMLIGGVAIQQKRLSPDFKARNWHGPLKCTVEPWYNKGQGPKVIAK